MKNKKIIGLLLMFYCSTTFLPSCHKSEVVNKPPTRADNTDILSIIEKYYNTSKKKTQGTFIFESIVTNNDPKLKNTVSAGGLFYDSLGQREPGGGLLQIGGNRFQPQSNGQYGFDAILPQNGLYGQNVTFSITPPASHFKALAKGEQNAQRPSTGTANAASGALTVTIYSPLPITVTNVAPQSPPVTFYSNTPFTIDWNEDPNNTQGVCIIAQYLPSLYANRSIRASSPKVIVNSILVPDNGAYVLPASFFSQFPYGGQIIMFVGRGNYTTIANANGTKNYKVGGYTATSIFLGVVAQTGTFTASTANGWKQLMTVSTATSAFSYSSSIITCNLQLSTTTPPSSLTTPFLVGNVSGAGIRPTGTRTFTGGVGLGNSTWTTTIYSNGDVYLQLVSNGTQGWIKNPFRPQLQGTYNW